MRMEIINIIPIFMNLTRRIEFRIKERYNFPRVLFFKVFELGAESANQVLSSDEASSP
jgi:hypothetical protein